MDWCACSLTLFYSVNQLMAGVYNGAKANAKWQITSGGCSSTVPLENSAGTADLDWDETCLTNLQMTGIFNRISPRYCVAAFKDVGNTVNDSTADESYLVNTNKNCVRDPLVASFVVAHLLVFFRETATGLSLMMPVIKRVEMPKRMANTILQSRRPTLARPFYRGLALLAISLSASYCFRKATTIAASRQCWVNDLQFTPRKTNKSLVTAACNKITCSCNKITC